VWGATVPTSPGRDGAAILAATTAGELGGLVVAGVDPDDLSDPAGARRALESAGFVVSLELRAGAVTEHADVVLPVAAPAEKAGSFVNWEGRWRGFGKVLGESHALPDLRVLAGIADELGVDLGVRTTEQARAELDEIGGWEPGEPGDRPREGLDGLDQPGTGSTASTTGFRLATWKQLVGDGRMLDGDAALRATARPPVVLVSGATLTALGVAVGDLVTLTGPVGSTTLPVGVADLPDGVVWTPTTSTTAGWVGSEVTVVGLSVPEVAEA
ncbi:MAG: molybdopterin dinucleotide binding domain-containing protein, partial [Nocardioidaceae bacterium]